MSVASPTPRLAAIAALIAGLLAVNCAGTRTHATVDGAAAFQSTAWDDGLAVVSVFQGRVKRYGVWREAVVRDYLVREYLDPADLTKRDDPRADSIPVLKANRMLEFETGSYGYRLMTSFHFSRESGDLLQARGTCLSACGIVTHAWDAPSGRLRSDSYWEGEGSSSVPLPLQVGRYFGDELPFVTGDLDNGSTILVLPPIAAPRALWKMAALDERGVAGIGIGDTCEECADPSSSTGFGVLDGTRSVAERELRIERVGRTTRLIDANGELQAEYTTDPNGHLEAWTVVGEQEFRRVNIFRGAYWGLTDPSHQGLVFTK